MLLIFGRLISGATKPGRRREGGSEVAWRHKSHKVSDETLISRARGSSTYSLCLVPQSCRKTRQRGTLMILRGCTSQAERDPSRRSRYVNSSVSPQTSGSFSCDHAMPRSYVETRRFLLASVQGREFQRSMASMPAHKKEEKACRAYTEG